MMRGDITGEKDGNILVNAMALIEDSRLSKQLDRLSLMVRSFMKEPSERRLCVVKLRVVLEALPDELVVLRGCRSP